MVNGNDRSEFNDAVGFLKRLDLFFKFSYSAMLRNDINGWITQLSVIYLELYNFIDENEREKRRKELKGLKNSVQEYIDYENRTGKSSYSSELYWRLFDFHEFLKKVYGESGLETKMLDDAGSALG